MKAKKLTDRKCSAILAAGAGVAVCLSSGEASAVQGTLTGTKANFTAVYTTTTNHAGTIVLNLSGAPEVKFEVVSYYWSASSQTFVLNATAANTVRAERTGAGKLELFSVGDSISLGDFGNPGVGCDADNLPLGAKKYVVYYFGNPKKYGWMEVTASGANNISIGQWSFESNVGDGIKTLAGSITTHKLALSGSSTKLHWTNDNEDGVARYEVQAKDASGEWQAVDSDTPGEGHYAAKVDNDAQCRLVVEKVDGTTEEVEF